MIRFFNYLFRRAGSVKMSEDENIAYSRKRLLSTINGDKNETLDKAMVKYLQEIRFPPVKDFKNGLEWFNVSEPLTFEKHLKGKLVVLDFFTYCCINCMHILPDLKEIEEEISIKDGLVVIGVHSAKFENEKNSQNILAAVQRYSISHPVVNDDGMDMWRKCDVHCWPTLLLLGPYANPIVMLTGEGHKNELKQYIKAALKYYKSQDLISEHKLPLESAYHLLPETKGPLLFPGKITNIVNDNEELFAVSDSGNNRILILNASGEILTQIGSSKAGFKDGTFVSAEFNNPQGVVFRNKDIIYVADTDNHAIRRVDLTRKIVETICGNGEQGHDYKGGKCGKQQPISSPWDLVLYQTEDGKDVLIIAMAGTHQIWGLFFEDTKWWKGVNYEAGTCVVIAGSGREENRNNQYPHTAGFAQPSGLALCKKNKEVYIADSESSSVRRLSLIDGKVTAVVGGDRNPHNLFAFGDKDGSLYDARLQHSLGLAISRDESTLFVADTYNHKIKTINLSRNSISTPSIDQIDSTDGSVRTFREPAGLCVSLQQSKLYITDTNNHSIKIIELDSGDKFTKITNLTLKTTVDNQRKLTGKIIDAKPIPLSKTGGRIILKIVANFSKNLKLTDAPQKWEVFLPNSSWSCIPMSGKDLNIDVVFNAPSNLNFNDVINFTFQLVTCTDSTCLPKNFSVRIPLNESEKSVKNAEIVVNLTPENVEIQ